MSEMLFPQTDSNDNEGGNTEVETTENGESTPSASSTENQDTTGQEGTEAGGENGKGKDKGFADDPRWQERENDWKERFNGQETRHAEEMRQMNERINQLTQQNGQGGKPSAPNGQAPQQSEAPAWWNGDQESWNEYQSHEDARVERILAARQTKQDEQKASETKRVEEATQYFNEQISEIEADTKLNPDGIKFDQNMKNKLLKIAEEHDLVDSKMRWNWKAAWRVLKATSTAPSTQNDTEAKKKVAAASTAKNGAEPAPSKVTGSNFFKKSANRPW